VTDPNQALRELRAALKVARRDQADDTDHPLYHVVANRTVTRILDSFAVLDAAAKLGELPDEWRVDTAGS
jgi:hypothetical protein